MADAREDFVWTNHALEQWADNKEGHKFNNDNVFSNWLKSIKVKKVLDYGCGGGLWRQLFKDFDYYGVDQNENMIAHARKRFPKIADHFQVIDWANPSIPDNTYDLVFTSAVLQHNKHPDKAIAVQQIARIIKPGGYFMCTENTFHAKNWHTTFPKATEWNKDMNDGYSFTSMGWEKFMKPYGFELIEYKQPSEYLYRTTKIHID